MKESRKHPRFDTVIKIHDVTTERARQTKNPSLGGCLIDKSGERDFLPMASRITLRLDIPGADEPVVVHGIVRHRGKYREGFGIQFESIDKKSTYYIERFVGVFL